MIKKQASPIELQLSAQLQSRASRSLLRRLVVIPESSADFSSNDFLGLARNPRLNERFLNELESFPKHSPPLGSTGSRLLDGNSAYAEQLEQTIASFHNAEAALIFNSGFDANVGFFSSVPQPNDVILYDEYIHASVHDGMKVSRAGVKSSFRHNDLDHLAQLVLQVREEDQRNAIAAAARAAKPTGTTPPNAITIAAAASSSSTSLGSGSSGVGSTFRQRNIFVAVESVYSMDGDTAPLREIVDLLEPHGGYLIVDEAHATGVYGTQGRGLVNELGLEDRIFARLHTFSKALASNGAALVGPEVLKQYLINYARPLIYSTFTSFSNLASVKAAYDMLMAGETIELVEKVRHLITYFRSHIRLPDHMLLPSNSPIQGIVLNGNEEVNALSSRLIAAHLNVKAIRFPTVPKGKERVRICLHAHNTIEQVQRLIEIVHQSIHPSSDPIMQAPGLSVLSTSSSIESTESSSTHTSISTSVSPVTATSLLPKHSSRPIQSKL
ncbi:biotin synthase [Podila epigama]|nr:biotin synthase [Podila epigama]